MTERLSQLLHDEATGLVLPPPDAARVLRVLEEGRRLGRRRRARTGLVGLAAAAAVAVAGFAVLGVTGDQAREAVPADAPDRPAAYAIGSQVAIGDAVATVPDTVHSLHYTSDGVLVRSNPNGGASDGSGPETLTLVGWDGATTDLGTIPEGVGPATDPDRGVYVLAEPAGEGFVAVVRDASTGDVVQEVPLPDGRPSYWSVPPLGLDGDDLYVGFRDSTAIVDLASGEATTAPGLPGGIPDVAGGQVLRQTAAGVSVIEGRDGQTVLDVEVAPGAPTSASLSPDGRWVLVTEATRGSTDSRLIEVDTGEEVVVGLSGLTGWTATGEAFELSDDGVTTCSAPGGECSTDRLPIDWPANAFPRLGGVTYES